MVLPRSRLALLTQPDAFYWATGIEDSFIIAPWPKNGRIMDEYELTGHYQRWREDLALMARLGVRTARYGVPWHRISPAPRRWDWSWSERSLERLLELGIDPIVDLVHYGVPQWMEGAWLHPDFPEHMAEYAARLAERFRGRIRWWTPLNEPRITAWNCGKLGWWPPCLKGWHGFVQVLLPLCRGIVRTGQALRAVDSENVLVHVDATNLWLPPVPHEEDLIAQTQFRRDLVFLALDLISGRVSEEHPLWHWLLRHGASAATLEWFQEHGIELDIIGLNLYPMLSQKQFVRSSSGRVYLRYPYGCAAMIEQIVELYWNRYHRPMMIAETAGRGRVARRMAWLHESVAGVRHLRERGIPLVGYTWWPMFALVAWAYRQGNDPLGNYVVQMGLWDLDRDTLERVHTPLVDAYRELVTGGAKSVGLLSHES
ncbi:MAG: family 1 glycosylhydrolase [Armatimonadota bacterium]|nr:family 1 glycosylhydrolase [Armatimonadota bacterium]